MGCTVFPCKAQNGPLVKTWGITYIHPERGLTQRAVGLPHKLRDVVDDASPHGGRLAGRGGGDRAVDAHEKGSDGRRGDASGSYSDRGVRAGGDEVELVVRPRREGAPSAAPHFVSIKESTAAAPGGFTLGRSRVSSRSRSASAGIEYTSPSIPPARLTVARYSAAPIERPREVPVRRKTRLPSWQGHGHKHAANGDGGC